MQELFQRLADTTLRLAASPHCVEALAERAEIFIQTAQWLEARADIEALIAEKAYDAALPLLNKAIERDEPQPWAYLLRGSVRYRLHATNEAFADLQQFAALAPEAAAQISGLFQTKEAPSAFVIPTPKQK